MLKIIHTADCKDPEVKARYNVVSKERDLKA